jgi:tetratricopeptide (TPR) repeat protein
LGLSRLANLRGSWWKRKEDMAQAEQAFTRAIRLAAEGEDAYHEAIALMNLAILRQDLGDWREADRTYARAFEREAGIDQPLLACKLRNNRINLLLYLGRSQEAEAECYEFLKVALRARYPDQQASALGYLALLAGQKNDRAGQLRHLEQALSLIQPRQHPQLYFQCMLDRGQLQYATERYAAAQIDAECAEQAARRSANPTWLALAQLLLGKIFRDRPKPQLDTASRLFNEAHHAAWKQKNLSLLWELDFERGRLAQRRGETERARNYLRTAKATLEKLLAQLPEAARNSYLRDRKGEHLEAAWRQLPP